MINKSYTKGTPAQFHNQLVNKIQELGGTVESSQQINASADITLNDIQSKLNTAIGSRMEALPAVVVNLGDGTTGVIFEDSNTGDSTLIVVTMNSDVRTYATMNEVYADVLETWGVDASVDSATNLSITGDKLVANSWSDLIELLNERGYEVDSIHREQPEQFITLYKGEKEYYAEVTHYTDGTYEVQMYNIHNVGTRQVASAEDINAADAIDDADYIEQLGQRTVEILETEYHKNADFEVSEATLIINVYNVDDVLLHNYIQPIEDIEPIAEDLESDAHTLAKSVIENIGQ